MDNATKLSRVKREIDMISRADDTDSVIRNALLDQIEEHIKAERAAIAERLSAKITGA